MRVLSFGILQADTTYFYQIYDQDAGAWSPTTLQFTTVPGAGATRLKFAVFGDLGEASAHHNGNSTIEWLGKVQDDIALIWHAGDVGWVARRPQLQTHR